MTIHVTLFTEDWYHGIIRQTQESFDDDTTADGHALATAQLTGLCCIAQAIDHAFKHHDSDITMLDYVRDIALAFITIAESMTENRE